MATWTITPSGGVTNNNDGSFVFPQNPGTTKIDYTITYTDDNGCSGSTTYTILPAVEQHFGFGYDDSNLSTETSVTWELSCGKQSETVKGIAYNSYCGVDDNNIELGKLMIRYVSFPFSNFFNVKTSTGSSRTFNVTAELKSTSSLPPNNTSGEIVLSYQDNSGNFHDNITLNMTVTVNFDWYNVKVKFPQFPSSSITPKRWVMYLDDDNLDNVNITGTRLYYTVDGPPEERQLGSNYMCHGITGDEYNYGIYDKGPVTSTRNYSSYNEIRAAKNIYLYYMSGPESDPNLRLIKYKTANRYTQNDVGNSDVTTSYIIDFT